MSDQDDNIDDLEDTVAADEGDADGDAELEDTVEAGEDDADDAEPKKVGADDLAAEGHKSRASQRIKKLAKERDELRDRATRAEALAEERAAQRQTPTNNADATRQREEKLALMDPSERKDFLRDEAMQNMEQKMLLSELRTADTLDKNAYIARAAVNGVYAKHTAEVEKRLSEERRNGRNWTRETILAQVIGEAALKAKPDAKKKNEAKERVDSSKSTPTRARSDSTAHRPGRSGESFEDLESRLENVTF